MFCNNIKELVEVTCRERDIQVEDADLHVGFDGGQGSLKLTLTITDRAVKSVAKGRSSYKEVLVHI